MSKKIYVGNLPFSASEEEIRNLFAAHGNVHNVTLISDRETGRPRGFGFVEMDDEGVQAAIDAINGTEFSGRTLNVNEARERKGGGGGGGGQRGGGGGGRPRRDF
jgi:RNA recognition motif-containing protein